MNYRRRIGFYPELKRAVKYICAIMVRSIVKARLCLTKTKPNLILLESYLGTRLDCNPLAVYNFLQKNYPGKYQYIWVAEEPSCWEELEMRANTEVVKYRSPLHWKYACLSNVLITNSPRSNELPARRNQLQIQTWHGGGCYKRVGTALHDRLPVARAITLSQFNRFNYFISSSKFFTNEVIRKQFGYRGKVLESGMPRNDRLICEDEGERFAIRARLGIGPEKYFVLYAPTWRDFSGEPQDLPVSSVKAAFSERFKIQDIILGVRGHYFSNYSSDLFDLNLDKEKDMQGLLLACDAVITDYSSVIWDFSFTGRPCFLYTPDLSQYKTERGFDVDIYEWGFPVCENSDELIDAIRSFDQDAFNRHMVSHHSALGSFESGHACEAVAEVINQHCFRKRESI